MKKFSFVIPTYQNKKLLKNTLEALNRQKGYGSSDYEVVVVDDGSSDYTWRYIRGTNKNYELKYIYLPRCPQSSRSRARNRGWREAGGEIVVFIDSDIIVREDYLAELDRCCRMGGNLAVLGTRLMLDREVSLESVKDGSVFTEHAFDGRNIPSLEVRHFAFDRFSYNLSACRYPWLLAFSCNLAVPRSYIEEIAGFDENFRGWGLEDNDLAYRLCKKGIKIIVNSRLEVLHQYHGFGSVDEEVVEENVDYFLAKHPGVFELSRDEMYDFFKGKTKINLGLAPDKPLPKRMIEFRDRTRLDDLKRLVLRLVKHRGVELAIYDYVEDTDLDLWIQLMGTGNSIAKYFPVSKRLEMKQMPAETR